LVLGYIKNVSDISFLLTFYVYGLKIISLSTMFNFMMNTETDQPHVVQEKLPKQQPKPGQPNK